MDNKDNINTILKFMPKSQAMCFIAGLNGAEQEHFKRIANKIAEIIKQYGSNAPPKEDLIIMFGIISRGVYNILKYARTGIYEWKHIKHKEKDKQLSFKLTI